MPTDHPHPPRKIPWGKLALIALVLVAAVALMMRGHTPREVLELGHAWVDRGMMVIRNAGPWVFFSAMAILPAVGMPLLGFTIPAGEAFAAQMSLPGVIAVTMVAIAVNLALTYWIAHNALRPLVERLIKRYGYTVPRVTKDNALSVALVVRLTPGPPFFLQGCVLAISGVPFRLFMIVSWLCVIPWAVGAIVLGRGVLNGNFRIAGMGMGVLVVAIIVLQWLRKKYTKREG